MVNNTQLWKGQCPLRTYTDPFQSGELFLPQLRGGERNLWTSFLKAWQVTNSTAVCWLFHSALALTLPKVLGQWMQSACCSPECMTRGTCQTLGCQDLAAKLGLWGPHPLQAHVSFKPTVAQQRRCPNCTETAVDGELVVVYDVNREEKAGELEVSASWLQNYPTEATNRIALEQTPWLVSHF